MGVDGLWEIIEGAAKEESLLALTLREGIGKANRRMPYRLGVDASIWFRECQSVFKFGHAQAGENPELRTLFYRLCRLFELPVDVLFVFDGPGRPSRKRGMVVKTANHWITSSFKDLIEAFGFSWQMAPGEAEAELAFLNRTGIIDAVVTDDSDVFVFGVDTVIRK
ncbi:hypothetical protein EVJ58_g8753 [Rhodofomes roseus]|uniref:XPG-I domain-containing protein n=1 Tax=Rhodofomes roseus TaxID=34475 RepID=A0A4Y9XWU8_9APHY|nr:hypothetical protein EVJ58_g8753 [Rhodofomes roseus]